MTFSLGILVFTGFYWFLERGRESYKKGTSDHRLGDLRDLIKGFASFIANHTNKIYIHGSLVVHGGEHSATQLNSNSLIPRRPCVILSRSTAKAS